VTPRRLFSSLTIVWAKPDYRTFFLLLLVSSIGTSASAPLIALYLVDRLHVPLSLVGLYFVCQALPGFVAGVMIGRWSDRWRSRIPIIRVASVSSAIGWVIFAFSPYVWLDYAVAVVFFGLGGAAMGQAFAAVHDVMTRDDESQPGLINSAVRTGWSFGFVFGPVLGTMLAAHAGFRIAFLVPAALSLANLVLLRGVDIPVVARRDDRAAPEGFRSNLLLYLFAALTVLVLCGTAIKNSYLPIDVTTHLHGTVGLYGTIVAVSPIVELVAMPLCGILSLRYPLGRLIAIGLGVATVEYFLLSASTALWQIYLIQAMDAWVVAIIMGLGLTYAQRLAPDRAGLVSGTFGSSYGVAIVTGNLIGSAAVPLLGVPHIFFLPTALCAVSLLTFLGIERASRRPVEQNVAAASSAR